MNICRKKPWLLKNGFRSYACQSSVIKKFKFSCQQYTQFLDKKHSKKVGKKNIDWNQLLKRILLFVRRTCTWKIWLKIYVQEFTFFTFMYYFIELTLRIASFLTLMLVCVCQEGGLGVGGGGWTLYSLSLNNSETIRAVTLVFRIIQ